MVAIPSLASSLQKELSVSVHESFQTTNVKIASKVDQDTTLKKVNEQERYHFLK